MFYNMIILHHWIRLDTRLKIILYSLAEEISQKCRKKIITLIKLIKYNNITI